MTDLSRLLALAAEHTAAYRAAVSRHSVGVPVDLAAVCDAFAGPLPDAGTDGETVIEELVAAARTGLVASTGPRYFGFVTGGALPSATAAEMLTVAWDQNAFNATSSPAAYAAEAAAGTWLKELLGLPLSASVGFVTGAQAANTAGLASGRHHVLAEAGWDVERRGLFGAPRVRVVASTERHATVDRSLRLLGFGSDLIEPVATDANGALDVEDLRRVLASAPPVTPSFATAGLAGARSSRSPCPTIVCLQAGNVNTGACDDLRAATGAAREHGAWVHVDGAFGLWAAASPATRPLVDGVELADSWGCDGHKWLNVPYDSAFAFCAHPETHAAAMSYTAAYLTGAGATVGAADFTAESSRRARGFSVWAALRELGRDGVADLVERCCRLARFFADGLTAAGFEVVNDVVLNQVLVSVGDDTRTDGVVTAVQQDGTCWLGATTWRGRRLVRVSVSNHTTTEADVTRSITAITAAASR